MGLFSHKPIQGSISPMGRGPPIAVHREKTKAVEDDEIDEDVPKKVYAKEKAPEKQKESDKPETETDKNTRLNALLFNTSEESVDNYRSENTSSDLLGRLYYDDYESGSTVTTPGFLSPSGSERSNTYLTLEQASQRLRSPSPAKRPPLSRLSSFERGVSFDTLEDTHHMAITLKVKHPQFKFRRNNKTYLVGFNNDVESLRAIEWTLQEMVIHGDTIIVLQVLDEKVYKQIDNGLAEQVLEKVEKLNTHTKKISIVFEAAIGKPQKLLRRAIEEYKPAMMVVGTHHYEKAQIHQSSQNLVARSHPTHTPTQPHKHRGFLSKASISKYFLQYALVPCIVVKPIYHYQEQLDKPIENERYFQDWIGNIDITSTKEEKKKRNRISMALSPSSSRNSSQTNLAELETKERLSRSVNLDAQFNFRSREASPAPDTDANARESKTHSRLSRFFGH